MKSETKIFKKVKKFKPSINKIKRINSHNKLDKFREQTEYEDESESYIHSKSQNKIKNKNGFTLKKNKTLKLPLLQQNISMNGNGETTISKLPKKILNKNYSLKKININTTDIDNYQSNNKNSIKLTKHNGSAYKLKISENYIKSKNQNFNTNENIGMVRHLDRKIIKEKKIMMPKKGYKLFTTTKIINNFNNQINQNKNKEIYTMCNNNVHETNNNNEKSEKIDVLYDLEKKISKIQNCFRKHLKDEDINLKKENKKHTVVDIISDISLSDNELNFSKEDYSFDNMNISLDDEEI